MWWCLRCSRSFPLSRNLGNTCAKKPTTRSCPKPVQYESCPHTTLIRIYIPRSPQELPIKIVYTVCISIRKMLTVCPVWTCKAGALLWPCHLLWATNWLPCGNTWNCPMSDGGCVPNSVYSPYRSAVWRREVCWEVHCQWSVLYSW